MQAHDLRKKIQLSDQTSDPILYPHPDPDLNPNITGKIDHSLKNKKKTGILALESLVIGLNIIGDVLQCSGHLRNYEVVSLKKPSLRAVLVANLGRVRSLQELGTKSARKLQETKLEPTFR